MMMRSAFSVFLLCTILLNACKQPEEKVRERGLSDLNNAIKIIESRREAEYAIIEASEGEIMQLRENADNARGESLRQKYQREAEMKRIGIEKAHKNIANQDTILNQLYAKRDSILGL